MNVYTLLYASFKIRRVMNVCTIRQFLDICMHACMYASMYVSMYVCMYVCKSMYKISLAANRKEYLMAIGNVLLIYLSGPLPYAIHHITITDVCWMIRQRKHFLPSYYTERL